MKFTDNFKVHQIEGEQRVAMLYYLEAPDNEPTGFATEGSIQELSITPRILQVQLESKIIDATITDHQISDLKNMGIDAISETKKALNRDFDIQFEKELYNKAFEIARNVDSVQEFTGIKRFLYKLFGYSPKVWIESNQFLKMIVDAAYNILQESRIGAGNWIVVSPKTAAKFARFPEFIYRNDNNIDGNVRIFGLIHSIKVFSTHLISDDVILMGRNPTGDTDQLVSAIVGPKNSIYAKQSYQSSYETIHKIGIKTSLKVFGITGSEKSYVKLNFSNQEPNLWKHILKLYWHISPFSTINSLFKRNK